MGLLVKTIGIVEVNSLATRIVSVSRHDGCNLTGNQVRDQHPQPLDIDRDVLTPQRGRGKTR
jgi:hypothetical protein